jgi:uncharacterized protein YndB with AHSA1/START domain
MAQNTGSKAAEYGVGMEVRFTRVFDAPRELVWAAWTEPKHLQQWWGPSGFTNPRCDWDARPGGKIHIDMKGPDGRIYPMDGRVEEIKAPERMVFMSAALDEKGERIFENLNTVTLEDRGEKTVVTVVTRVVKATANAPQYLKGMEMGWTLTLDRLDAHVKQAAGGGGSESVADREIVISRVFDAPRELVWSAWTDAKHIVNWWGPRGFTTTIHEMEVRPGGVWKQTMHGPDGTDYPGESRFIEVKKPERIVYVMEGGKAGAARVQFEATWTFEEMGEKTRVTISMLFPTAAAREENVRTYRSVEGGNQTLERLAEYLADRREN